MITGSIKTQRSAAWRISVLITYLWLRSWRIPVLWEPSSLNGISLTPEFLVGVCSQTPNFVHVEFLKIVLFGKVLNIAELQMIGLSWTWLSWALDLAGDCQVLRSITVPLECCLGLRALSKCPVWAEVDWISRIESHICLLCLKEMGCQCPSSPTFIE